MSSLFDIICILCMISHLFICPFNKVEESFSTQATHDILYFGPNLQYYDHLEFPGVVPRSFLGPLYLATMSSPFITFIKTIGLSKLSCQFIIRMMLGLTVWYGFKRYQMAISLKFGHNVGKWLLLITASQFHFIFYMTRTLPNIFAASLVFHSLAWCLKKNHMPFILASACSIIVCRSELIILMGMFLISELITKKLTIINALKYSIPSGILWLFLTILIDSFFWGHWIWPEAQVLYYNTILNKSSNWGTQPLFWYFYSALPRALGFSIILLPIGVYLETGVRQLFLPAIIYVSLYSFLPHKELRFIYYVFPIFNTVSAAACARIWRSKSQNIFKKMLSIFVILHLVFNIFFTSIVLYISSNNYPGGNAMELLHKLETKHTPVNVHICAYAAQTGVSRFTELNSNWRYSKKENINLTSEEILGFSHLILYPGDENEHLYIFNITHSILAIVKGEPFLTLPLKNWNWIKINLRPVLYILKKN